MKSYRIDMSMGVSDVVDKLVFPANYATCMDNVSIQAGSATVIDAPVFVRPVGSSDNFMWSFRGKFYLSENHRDYVGEVWGSREQIYYTEHGQSPMKTVSGQTAALGIPRPTAPPHVDAQSSLGLGVNLTAIEIPPAMPPAASEGTEDDEADDGTGAGGTDNWGDSGTGLGDPGDDGIGSGDWKRGGGKIVLSVPNPGGETLNLVKTGSVGGTPLPSAADWGEDTDASEDPSGITVDPTYPRYRFLSTTSRGMFSYRLAPIVNGKIGVPCAPVTIFMLYNKKADEPEPLVPTWSNGRVLLTWQTNPTVDGWVVFGRKSGSEAILTRLPASRSWWIDEGYDAPGSDLASKYDLGDAYGGIRYLITYERNVGGMVDESGPSLPSSEVELSYGRKITRPSNDRVLFDGPLATQLTLTSDKLTVLNPFTTGNSAQLTMVSETGSGNRTMVYTEGPHSFKTGDKIVFFGFKDSGWNQEYYNIVVDESFKEADNNIYRFVAENTFMPFDVLDAPVTFQLNEWVPENINLSAYYLQASNILVTGEQFRNHNFIIDPTKIGRNFGDTYIGFRIKNPGTYRNRIGGTVGATIPMVGEWDDDDGVVYNTYWDNDLGGYKIAAIPPVEGYPHLTDVAKTRHGHLPRVEIGADAGVYCQCHAVRPVIQIDGVTGVADGDILAVVVYDDENKVILDDYFKCWRASGDPAGRCFINAKLDGTTYDNASPRVNSPTVSSVKISMVEDKPLNSFRTWNIYRTGDTTDWKLVAKVPIRQKTYIDVIPTSSLGSGLGTAYVSNGVMVVFGPPPKGMTGLTKHMGMLFGIYGNTVRWTPIGKPDAWPDTFQTGQMKFKPLALAPWQGALFVICEDTFYRIDGVRPEAMRIEPTNVVEGCTAPYSVQVTPRGIVYASRSGLMVFDGVGTKRIADDRLSREFFYGYSRVTASPGYWCIPTQQSHFYAVAAIKDGVAGSTQVGYVYNGNMIDGMYGGVTNDLRSAYSDGRYYLYWRGPNRPAHTIVCVDMRYETTPITTIGVKPLSMHATENGALHVLVDNQRDLTNSANAASDLADWNSYLSAQYSFDPELQASGASGRAIVRFGGQLPRKMIAFVNTGYDSFGAPYDIKRYNSVDFYGSGPFKCRVYVDGVLVCEGEGVASDTPSLSRRVSLPIGTQGYGVSIECIFEQRLRFAKFDYDLMGGANDLPDQ